MTTVLWTLYILVSYIVTGIVFVTSGKKEIKNVLKDFDCSDTLVKEKIKDIIVSYTVAFVLSPTIFPVILCVVIWESLNVTGALVSEQIYANLTKKDSISEVEELKRQIAELKASGGSKDFGLGQ